MRKPNRPCLLTGIVALVWISIIGSPGPFSIVPGLLLSLDPRQEHLFPTLGAVHVDLIEQCRLACDELSDVAGRATIRAVLELSVE